MGWIIPYTVFWRTPEDVLPASVWVWIAPAIPMTINFAHFEYLFFNREVHAGHYMALTMTTIMAAMVGWMFLMFFRVALSFIRYHPLSMRRQIKTSEQVEINQSKERNSAYVSWSQQCEQDKRIKKLELGLQELKLTSKEISGGRTTRNHHK